jgi:ubiquinone/menaquinone biosynthesis C-methylase UbiE
MINSIEKQFSKSSNSYEKSAFIQKKIARELVKKIDKQFSSIVDFGSGNGFVYKNISWKLEHFLAIDISENMLKNHPVSDEVSILKGDFDDDELWKNLDLSNFDAITSSSAFQWSKDICKIFQRFNKDKKPLYLAIFTDRTFSNIHEILKIKSPIFSKKEILNCAENLFFEVKRFEIKNLTPKSSLKYIKESGVSGGDRGASNSALKEFLKSRERIDLSLEVIFLWRNG